MYEQHDSRLRLAVCDDEPVFCGQIVEWSRENLQQEQIEAGIERFESAQSLLERIGSGTGFSILLLDVMMDGMAPAWFYNARFFMSCSINGISLSRMAVRISPSCSSVSGSGWSV